MKTTNWIENFEDKFIHLDHFGKKVLNMLYVTNYAKSDPIILDEDDVIKELKNFITTLLEKQREEYVEIIRKTKLPQNSSSNGTSTLLYIPNESFNISVNNRIDWIIDKIKQHDK